MKQWILGFFLMVMGGSLSAKEKGEFVSDWVPVPSNLSIPFEFSFPGSETVELFESFLYFQIHLFFQTKNKDKQLSIYQYNLNTAKFQTIPWNKGKVLGWTECKGMFLVQTKLKLYGVNPNTWEIKKDWDLRSQSSNWKDIVCSDGDLFRLDKDELEVFDLETLEEKPKIPLPMKSVQRIVKGFENEILLISSFSGNTIKSFSLLDKQTTKEWKFPTNHRALFKMTQLTPDRFLVFDPITKIYGEWILFDGQLFPTSGLSKRSDGKAIRFSPIESTIHFQLELTATSDLPETNYHVILPKKDTYAQELREETFYSPSVLSLDETGNRTLTVTIPSLKEGETKSIPVYSGKLTRYKIHWKLESDISVKREESESKFPNELRDDWFLKLEDPIVVGKREELFQGKSSVKELLLETAKYVSSIPYKSGKFEAAPKVIEKNNGGCTEHSYVTMSLLRGVGIPARLVWNYLPTEASSEMSFNHKYVEVWVEGYGWIPMEPLAPPRSKPGVTHVRHLVFSVLPTPVHPKISGGDRLVQLTKEQLSLGKKVKMKLNILKKEKGESSDEGEDLPSIPKNNRSILTGEEMVVP
ncbi:transglutaminase-like domain-containing protein [Leptospira jelokensis]|uniref:Transglutaminase domain-containing protein n=1 Tax=Leptospira jelokensis TaxID=2484931 RepID=A0A4Z0ZV23_9LEPT|nr:transglutaminase domain-containing protein [Leptospira jelokensis]TGL72400.1 transglutaminase domain-containing protein [Leptospira jelokensis]